MQRDEDVDAQFPDTPGILDGWKDIASYLGRSPRTVQRWERDLDLPIHRIPTPDGGAVVYALRAELDGWRSRQSAASLGQPGGATAAPVVETRVAPELAEVPVASPAPDPPATAPGFLRRVANAAIPVWAALGLAGVAVLTFIALGSARRSTGVAAAWDFEGRELHAYSNGGRLIWTHDFGRVASRPASFARKVGPQADVNNDGRDEVLIPMRFAPPSATSTESDAVVAFGPEGEVVWSVQPQLTMRWGDETFSGPWNVQDIVTGMAVRGPRTWIAFSHQTWWPGFVMEVEPNGDARLQYVQPGRIYSLTYWPRATGNVLLAGGTLNEAASASVALVDVDGAPARWADKAGPPLCFECPTVDPAGMLLLPTSEVSKAMLRPYGWVMQGKPVAGGVELSAHDGFGRGSIVTLSDNLRVTDFLRSDQYWQAHRELEKQGRLDHTVDICPDLSQPQEVRRWTPADGWSTIAVPLRVSFSAPPASD